jgi:hypothetical protein
MDTTDTWYCIIPSDIRIWIYMVVWTFLVMKQHTPPFLPPNNYLYSERRRNRDEDIGEDRGQTDLNGSFRIHALESDICVTI